MNCITKSKTGMSYNRPRNLHRKVLMGKEREKMGVHFRMLVIYNKYYTSKVVIVR